MRAKATVRAGRLAIDGGTPACRRPPPPRRTFGDAELAAVNDLFAETRGSGYGGLSAAARFGEAFAAYHGGGFAVAVGSGSAAVFAGLAAFDLPKGSEVVVAPVAEPGIAMAVCLLGLRPVVCDAAAGGYNADAGTVAAALTDQTRALLLTHAGGFPLDMAPILDLAAEHRLVVVEDTSQAHGARRGGRLAGTFGDMLVAEGGDTLAPGGRGGLVWSADADRYRKAHAHAAGGRPPSAAEPEAGEAGAALFPALDLELDDLSAAIGRLLLGRLDASNRRRRELWARLAAGLAACQAVDLCAPPEDSEPTFAFAPLRLHDGALTVDKRTFAAALAAEGVRLNPHHRNLVAEWPWYRRLTNKAYITPAAQAFRDASLDLLFHEGYADADADAVATAVRKVAMAYAR